MERLGSKVIDTRVSTSAAAAGERSTSSSRSWRASSGERGSTRRCTCSVSVEPGSGAVSTVTATHATMGFMPRSASHECQLATQASAWGPSTSHVERASQRSVAVSRPVRWSCTKP